MSRKSNFLLFSTTLIFAFSCTSVKKNQNLYSYKPVEGRPSELTLYKNNKPFGAKISEKDGVTYVTATKRKDRIVENTTKDPATRAAAEITHDQRFTTPPKYYFSSGELKKDLDADASYSFKYTQAKLLVQPVATAFKYRLRTDTRGGVFEDGVKPAIGVNAQGSAVKLLDRQNILGLTKRTVFINLGLFAGFGTIKLNAGSTNQQVTVERTALIVPYGGNLMFGLNNINLGIAWGRDIPMGHKAKYWEYKKKNWIGVVVGLDILK